MNLFATLAFFIGAAVLVYGLLRKRCCKTCYYCKTCTVGFGKLPELFFRKNGTENVSPTGLKMFPLAYAFVGFIPIVSATFSLTQEFTVLKVAVLVLLVAIAAYSGLVRRKLLLSRKT